MEGVALIALASMSSIASDLSVMFRPRNEMPQDIARCRIAARSVQLILLALTHVTFSTGSPSKPQAIRAVISKFISVGSISGPTLAGPKGGEIITTRGVVWCVNGWMDGWIRCVHGDELAAVT